MNLNEVKKGDILEIKPSLLLYSNELSFIEYFIEKFCFKDTLLFKVEDILKSNTYPNIFLINNVLYFYKNTIINIYKKAYYKKLENIKVGDYFLYDNRFDQIECIEIKHNMCRLKFKDNKVLETYIDPTEVLSNIYYCETENKKEENMNKYYTITRNQMLAIYNIACPLWKEKIIQLTYDIFETPFKETAYISTEYIEEIFEAATVDQLPVLEEIFTEYLEDKKPKFKEGDLVWVRGLEEDWKVRYFSNYSNKISNQSLTYPYICYNGQKKEGETSFWIQCRAFEDNPLLDK